MEELIQQLDFEWDRFFLDLMRTSKPNIFAKSKEIEQKKYIVVFMKKQIDELPKQVIRGLHAHDNILEAIYCYILDHQDEKTMDVKIKEFIWGREEKANGKSGGKEE